MVTRKIHFCSPVQHILVAQVGATLLAALVLMWFGPAAAFSALTGGLICVAANAYAAWRALRPQAMASAAGTLSNLYRAEMGKLMMIGAMFIAVFTAWDGVNIGAFIAGSMAAMIAGAISPAFQRADWHLPHNRQVGTETDGE